jgi:hypothetical protein
MKDAQKPDHVSLNTLVNYLRDGRFVIPDFQREFEWKPWDIRELMRSIFLDYSIGSLLLWKGKTRTKQLFEKCPGGGGPNGFPGQPVFGYPDMSRQTGHFFKKCPYVRVSGDGPDRFVRPPRPLSSEALS